MKVPFNCLQKQAIILIRFLFLFNGMPINFVLNIKAIIIFQVSGLFYLLIIIVDCQAKLIEKKFNNIAINKKTNHSKKI